MGSPVQCTVTGVAAERKLSRSPSSALPRFGSFVGEREGEDGARPKARSAAITAKRGMNPEPFLRERRVLAASRVARGFRGMGQSQLPLP